jgi:hypothetical protein
MSADVNELPPSLRPLAEDLDDLVAGSARNDDGLQVLLGLVGLHTRMTALLVGMTGDVDQADIAVAREGLPLETVLGLVGGLPKTDRRMLLHAADVLTAMPRTSAAFRAGEMSWAAVRHVCLRAARFSVALRAQLDEMLAAGLADWDADRTIWEIDLACDELDPRDVDRRAKRSYEGRFANFRPFLDGSGGALYTELDTTDFATVMDATTVAGNRVDADGGSRTPGTRAADGLVEIADRYLAGGDDAAGPAKAAFTLVADARRILGPVLRRLPCVGDDGFAAPCDNRPESDASDTQVGGPAPDGPAGNGVGSGNGRNSGAAGNPEDGREGIGGLLLWETPRGPVALSPSTVERLACDADYRVVLRDGTSIVGVMSSAETVDDDLRAALVARDKICRFPGCQRPAHSGVAHHVTYRSDDGPTVIWNLVALCRAHHYAVHHRGFRLELLPDGTCLWRRGRRRWTTRPPDHPGGPAPPVEGRADQQPTVPAKVPSGSRENGRPAAPDRDVVDPGGHPTLPFATGTADPPTGTAGTWTGAAGTWTGAAGTPTGSASNPPYSDPDCPF